ncbi:MAG: cell division protein FtsA [Rhodospirillales bacterium]|nr:cell division protein FtsA [Rhodospirillales bacterium]
MIAALDIGTTKVACLVAQRDVEGSLSVVGSGQEVAAGMHSGRVVDMVAAEGAIRTAVHRAERMAGENVRSVFVGTSGGAPNSSFAEVEVDIGGREVADRDIQRAFDRLQVTDEGHERDILHAVPIDYALDGAPGIRDPRGMYAESLQVRLHMVSVANGSLRNLLSCVSHCDLQIAAPVAAAYASGLACLVSDEIDLGATCIDIGGGTTKLAIFGGGNLMWTETLPIGGDHVTNDIAQGLSTPIASAERMKRLHGSPADESTDPSESIEVPEIGPENGHSGAAHQVPRSMLTRIVRARMEEIFEFARARIEASGLDRWSGNRVVISGGASQISDLAGLAGRILDKQIRLARPLSLPGLAQAVSGPEFATCAGLLVYATRKHTEPWAVPARDDAAGPLTTTLARLGHWLRGNLWEHTDQRTP